MNLESTIKKASQKLRNNNIISYALDSQIILADIMGVTRESLIINNHVNISARIVEKIKKFINQSDSFFNEKPKQLPTEWNIFKKIFNTKNISRKECLLLPFRALSKALNS